MNLKEENRLISQPPNQSYLLEGNYMTKLEKQSFLRLVLGTLHPSYGWQRKCCQSLAYDPIYRRRALKSGIEEIALVMWKQRQSSFHPPKSPSRFRGRCSSSKAFVGNGLLSLCWEMTWLDMLANLLAIDQAIDERLRWNPVSLWWKSLTKRFSYGVIAPQGESNGLFLALKLVQNKPEDAQVISYYPDATSWLLKSLIFLQIRTGIAGNEIQWRMRSTPSIRPNESFCPWIWGQRYDVGDKFGFMKTSIDYALKHPQVKDDLKQYYRPWKKIRSIWTSTD